MTNSKFNLDRYEDDPVKETPAKTVERAEGKGTGGKTSKKKTPPSESVSPNSDAPRTATPGGTRKPESLKRDQRTSVNLTKPMMDTVRAAHLDPEQYFSLNDFVNRALEDYFAGRMKYPEGDK